MKSILILTGAVCALLLVSCASSNQKIDFTEVKTSLPSSKERTIEANIHSKVNSLRNGLSRNLLTRNARLDQMARKHSAFMAKNAGKFKLEGKRISHAGFKGRSTIARYGMDMTSVSENVAATSPVSNPSGVLVKAWRESRGHYVNMKAKYKYTGIGVVVGSDGYVYATQIFANPHIGRRWENGRPLF